MANAAPHLMAAGTIRPARFVKMSATAFKGAEADANEEVLGISADDTRDAPIPSVTAANHAIAGDGITLRGPGEECPLQLGSGGAAVGALLKSDADGKGVAIATTGTTIQNYGAQALQAGSEDELIRVWVRIGKVRPALS